MYYKMVKIIKANPIPTKQIECSNCKSILEYGNADLTLYESYMIEDKYKFTCPICGVDIEAKWIKDLEK